MSKYLQLDAHSEFIISLPDEKLVFDGTNMMSSGFNVVNVRGLSDPVTISSEPGERLVGWGEFETIGRYSAREIVIDGYVYDPHMLRLGHWRDRFNGILHHGGYGPMLVEEYSETRSLRVKRDEGGDFARKGSTHFVDFEIRFKGSDPRMYGMHHSYNSGSGNSLLLPQEGNTNAWASFNVTANTTMSDGYSLRLVDEATWSTTYGMLQMEALAVGSTHTIDMRTGVVRRGGIAGGYAVGGEMWGIPPYGEYRVFVSPNGAGSGRVSASYYDTYI